LSFFWDLLRVRAPHPGRRAGGLVLLHRRLKLIWRHCPRRRRIAAPRCEWIVLADQAREFSQRVGLGPLMLIAAAAKAVRAERSILISISHRDDVFPSGKPPPSNLQASRPLPEAPTRMQAAIDPRLTHLVWGADA
jgi:hypothetical protein